MGVGAPSRYYSHTFTASFCVGFTVRSLSKPVILSSCCSGGLTLHSTSWVCLREASFLRIAMMMPIAWLEMYCTFSKSRMMALALEHSVER